MDPRRASDRRAVLGRQTETDVNAPFSRGDLFFGSLYGIFQDVDQVLRRHAAGVETVRGVLEQQLNLTGPLPIQIEELGIGLQQQRGFQLNPLRLRMVFHRGEGPEEKPH